STELRIPCALRCGLAGSDAGVGGVISPARARAVDFGLLFSRRRARRDVLLAIARLVGASFAFHLHVELAACAGHPVENLEPEIPTARERVDHRTLDRDRAVEARGLQHAPHEPAALARAQDGAHVVDVATGAVFFLARGVLDLLAVGGVLHQVASRVGHAPIPVAPVALSIASSAVLFPSGVLPSAAAPCASFAPCSAAIACCAACCSASTAACASSSLMTSFGLVPSMSW